MPPKLSADLRRSLFSGRHSLIRLRALLPYPRCPTGRLQLFGAVFHQHRPDTKLAAQEQQTPDKDHKIDRRFLFAIKLRLHPAGNPTVRQLPGAIAMTELSIQCHLASSFQLVDVAGSGMRSCDTDRLRSLVISI